MRKPVAALRRGALLIPSPAGRRVAGNKARGHGVLPGMNQFFRSLAFSLALGAMLLRAALPAGWMPNRASPGDALLVICTPHGLQHVAPAQAPGHAPLPDHGNQACPFGAAAHLSPPQMLALAIAPAWSGALLALPPAPRPTAEAPDRVAHGPRAPPVLA